MVRTCQRGGGFKIHLISMDTAQTQQGPLHAAITLSKSNVIDFIRANGVGVPITLSPVSVRAFIEKYAESWQINLARMPRNLVQNCLRVGATKAEQAIKAAIPEGVALDSKLPKYLAANCCRLGAEAAEAAIGPWVLSEAKHTNPNRQEAGHKSSAKAVAFTTWKQTAGVRIIEPTDERKTFVCADVGVVIDSGVQFKAALAGNLLAEGLTEMEACRTYADANGIGWPDILKEANG